MALIYNSRGRRYVGATGLCVAVMAASSVWLALGSSAAPPEADDARYSMSPVDGGFVRLDKQSGAMTFCKSEDGNWSCKPMANGAPKEGTELKKLEAENKELKAEIERMEEVFGLDGKKASPGGGADDGPLAGPPGGLPELKLPSEKDVDQAVDYLE
ncbi:MAG: hypothetical protein AAFO75_00520, partial [Pseudomonadota bacterium]